MSENLEKTEKTLRDLIETLRDGHQGFIELEKNLKDPEARKVFREETLVRAGFAAELENELHHFGVKDVKVASSTAGKVHRAWGELKARLGGGDILWAADPRNGPRSSSNSWKSASSALLPAVCAKRVWRNSACYRQSAPTRVAGSNMPA